MEDWGGGGGWVAGRGEVVIFLDQENYQSPVEQNMVRDIQDMTSALWAPPGGS